MKLASGGPTRGLLVLAMLLLFVPSPAYAYLDPGTGSYILQLVIGTLLGGLFAVGLFWRRVGASFKRLFKRGGGDDGSRR